MYELCMSLNVCVLCVYDVRMVCEWFMYVACTIRVWRVYDLCLLCVCFCVVRFEYELCMTCVKCCIVFKCCLKVCVYAVCDELCMICVWHLYYYVYLLLNACFHMVVTWFVYVLSMIFERCLKGKCKWCVYGGRMSCVWCVYELCTSCVWCLYVFAYDL